MILDHRPFSHLPGQLHKKWFYQSWRNTDYPQRRQGYRFAGFWLLIKGHDNHRTMLFSSFYNKLLSVGKPRVHPGELRVLTQKRSDCFVLNCCPLKVVYPLGALLRYPNMNWSFPPTSELLCISKASADGFVRGLGCFERGLELLEKTD